MVEIRGVPVRTGGEPYIVAEVSCNHGGSLERAHHLIDVAAGAGADGVKFQLYTPDDMARPGGPPLVSGPWAGRTLYDLYTEAQTPRAWMAELAEHAHAQALGFAELAEHAHAQALGFIVSVFNPADVPFLVPLVDAFKIASPEAGWPDLLQAACGWQQPLIVSTGMATDEEVEKLVGTADIILHCVSGYPTPPEQANLGRLAGMVRGFHGYPVVGLSDHSRTELIPCMAVALGAALIEVHIMSEEGPPPLDGAFSWTPDGFRCLMDNIRTAYQAMQPPMVDVEADTRQFKRRLIDGRWLRG